MSVSVPQPFRTSVTVAQPFRAKIEGVPNAFTVGVTEIPIVPVSVSVEKIPVLHLSVDNIPPLHVSVDNIPPLHVSVDNIPPLHVSVDALPPIKVQLDPVEIRLTEIPSTRVHIPADFAVSLSLMGMDFGVVRLCGEAQVITEPYKPNPCEICSRTLAVDPVIVVRPNDPVKVDPVIVVRPNDPVKVDPNRPK